MKNATEVPALVEHLFRRQAGRIVARLTGILGARHLDLAEEAVQEALVSALQRWPFSGVPDNPAAWLVAVARNKALDRLRRRSRFQRKEDALRSEIEALQGEDLQVRFESEVAEDQLRMMFLCCHPALTREAAVTLILKTVGGFGVAEIARAFLSKEASIAQRLVRAKRKLRVEKAPFEMPAASQLGARLEPVLDALYLMFNEGYSAHRGAELIRRDVCREAIRLAGLLAGHPTTASHEVHALSALFLLQAARAPARLDSEGNLLLLSEQDRSRWDGALIACGFEALDRSIGGPRETAYHVEAAIASAHCLAERFEDTDWSGIRRLYDRLISLKPGPVVALNRAVAVAFTDGPAAGLAMLSELEGEPALAGYFLLPAVQASLLARMGRKGEAAKAYQTALGLPCSDPERRFLQRRLREMMFVA